MTAVMALYSRGDLRSPSRRFSASKHGNHRVESELRGRFWHFDAMFSVADYGTAFRHVSSMRAPFLRMPNHSTS
jgi:hypothetical protein